LLHPRREFPMSMPEQPLVVPTLPAEPAGNVLRLVTDGYRLLAELHDAIGQVAADPGVAQEHVTAATRELAAIQHLFERRRR
jgi:hypothetical protein